MMKASRRPLCLLAFAQASALFAADIHVAPNGSDRNPGTVLKPIATPHAARDAVRNRIFFGEVRMDFPQEKMGKTQRGNHENLDHKFHPFAALPTTRLHAAEPAPCESGFPSSAVEPPMATAEEMIPPQT